MYLSILLRQLFKSTTIVSAHRTKHNLNGSHCSGHSNAVLRRVWPRRVFDYRRRANGVAARGPCPQSASSSDVALKIRVSGAPSSIPSSSPNPSAVTLEAISALAAPSWTDPSHVSLLEGLSNCYPNWLQFNLHRNRGMRNLILATNYSLLPIQ